jgi:hypothetical protein
MYPRSEVSDTYWHVAGLLGWESVRRKASIYSGLKKIHARTHPPVHTYIHTHTHTHTEIHRCLKSHWNHLEVRSILVSGSPTDSFKVHGTYLCSAFRSANSSHSKLSLLNAHMSRIQASLGSKRVVYCKINYCLCNKYGCVRQYLSIHVTK